MNTTWQIKPFASLTPFELYAILQLRNLVFAVEQVCIFPDLDDRDQGSDHLMGWQNDRLVAYARLLPPGDPYAEASIGRVVTATAVRRTGIGRDLMLRSIDALRKKNLSEPIRIGAQLYLKEFYSSFGFRAVSDTYLEDGIEHIEMLLG